MSQDLQARIQELEALLAEKRAKNLTARNPKSLGFQIWRRRTALGLNQKDIRDDASRIEINDSKRGVTLQTLKQIADKLGCPAWEIVRDWEEANSACNPASSGEVQA